MPVKEHQRGAAIVERFGVAKIKLQRAVKAGQRFFMSIEAS
jgi:hypothetical protein